MSILLPLVTVAVLARADVVTVRPPDLIELEAERPDTVFVEVVIPKDLHVQANPASDTFLIPMELRLDLSALPLEVNVLYPAGENLQFGAGVDGWRVYSGCVSLPLVLTAAAPGDFQVRGELRYQGCTPNSCLRPSAVPVEFTVSVRPSPSSH